MGFRGEKIGFWYFSGRIHNQTRYVSNLHYAKARRSIMLILHYLIMPKSNQSFLILNKGDSFNSFKELDSTADATVRKSPISTMSASSKYL